MIALLRDRTGMLLGLARIVNRRSGKSVSPII
jgi:hypothetical protein